MGKGRIVSAEGEGLYTIELVEDRARANTERSLAVARMAALDERQTELESKLALLQEAVDIDADALDDAIAAYQAAITSEEGDPDGELKKEMVEISEVLIQISADRDAVAANIRRIKTERLAAQRRIDLIDALPTLRQQQAWCADLTEDLAGEVGTAEVPGEATQVLVHPGHDGAAAYDVARDGALQPALSGTAASVYYNLAMLPGWQKWRPTYRIATIDAIQAGADTCDITLVAASSSQQGLNVNAEPSYAAVPIEYMTCHAAAFEVGDRVLVRFDQDPDTPTVIGFESNPRPCGIDAVVAVPVVLHFDDLQGFLIGSACACGFATPGAGEYTQWAVEAYAYNLVFDNMLVWTLSTPGKISSALGAATADDFPTEDETATSAVEINSPLFEPTAYTYDFPTDDSGVCGTQQDQWSRVAVNHGPFDEAEEFFAGEMGVNSDFHEPINLDGNTFQVSYTPSLSREHFESEDYGVFTTADDGSECTAAYLLSHALDSEAVTQSVFTAFFNNMPSLVFADGHARTAKGLFHVVPADPTFSFDSKQLSFSGNETYIFSNQMSNFAYLLVGYGR